MRQLPLRPPAQRGWLLVGLIILISAVILALAGITFYLTEHLRSTSLRQNQTKAIYLAQAGVMQAIYDYRRNTGIDLRWYNVDNPAATPGTSDDAFRLSSSEPGDFLLMNMRNDVTFPTGSFCGATRGRIEDWSVRNVLASTGASLIVESFRVDWNTGTQRIIRLDLNGTGADWYAPGCNPLTCTVATCTGLATGTTIDLSGVNPTLRTIAPGEAGRWPQNRIWFTSSISGKTWIEVTFTVREGMTTSSRTARWDSTTANRTADITVRSTGEVREGVFPFSVWRRLLTKYRACATVSGTACDSALEEQGTRSGAIVSQQEQFTLTP